MLKAPDGYTSLREWLSGKAFPLTFFSFLLVMGGLALLREAALLAHEGIRLFVALELLRDCLTLGFLLLIATAYLTRTHAVALAHGFQERIFPMLTMFAGPAAVWFLRNSELPQRLDIVLVGLLLTSLGCSVSLWALWHLRGSFAIMAEARSPVMSGPYQSIRHPLYLGETLTLLGLCLMSGTAVALLFWAAITGMQLARASIEEAKLAGQFDDYRAYQQRTRFIVPGIY